ncbi:hypothetical protein [Streptomyces sp. NPDC002580]|uniref:hypothetical protein n=1 Tax=Streptomyces sp. NPDC002580 TaxID=3364653 RepID=UPI0036B14587
MLTGLRTRSRSSRTGARRPPRPVFPPVCAREINRRVGTSEPFALVLAVEDADGCMPRPRIVAQEHFTQVFRD